MYREIPKSQSFTSQSGNSPVRTRFWGCKQRGELRLERWIMEKNSVKKGRRLFRDWSWGMLSRIANGDKRVRYFLSSFRVIGCSSRALEKKKKKNETVAFHLEETEEAFCFLIISYFIRDIYERMRKILGKVLKNKQEHKNYCFFEERNDNKIINWINTVILYIYHFKMWSFEMSYIE